MSKKFSKEFSMNSKSAGNKAVTANAYDTENPFPPIVGNPFAARPANNTDPDPLPDPVTPRSEYEANELVQTIRTLVGNSSDDRWSGTAGQILTAANKEGLLVGYTAQRVNRDVRKLYELLRIFDDIYCFDLWDGNGVWYIFRMYVPDEGEIF